MLTNYTVEEWLTDLESMGYFGYWNDEAEELKKPFWILDKVLFSQAGFRYILVSERRWNLQAFALTPMAAVAGG